MSQMYEVKISLRGAKPPIWRRVIVDPKMKLKQLHFLIQMAFEWKNSHLHKFESADGPGYDDDSDDDDFDDFGCGGMNESKTLDEVFSAPKDKLIYEYDFGDSWEHLIVLEKIVPKEPNQTYPVCVTGKCMAPLDDCGGIYGFYNLIEAIENEDHPEHNDLKEWIEHVFGISDLSSRNFDKNSINETISENMSIFNY